MAGERIGAFELGEEIGAGGMGRVYRARDPRLARDVAIKVIADELRNDPERLRRFESEARAIAKLTHPNVMAIHDVGTHEGAPYLVCELLDGEPLRERLDKGPLAWRKAVEIAKQIAAGLAAVHAAGIVHRDLKPANVFVTRDGRVKLLDFGVARVAKVPEGDSTIDGAVIGTAGYMAPEQVRGEPADARADLFALGAVLYELLAGQKAFDGATDVERGYAVLKTEPADLPSTVPAPLARVVQRCLEKRRDERFESARDLGFALEALLDTSATAPPAVARPRHRRWLLALALGVTLVGAAGAGYLLRSTSAPATTTAAPAKKPTFEAITFRRGKIEMARFPPDPSSVVYSATWSGEPMATYVALRGHPDARTLHADNLVVCSIASSGELLMRKDPGDWFVGSTLSRASLAGGVPRPVLDNVIEADWIPGRDELAVIRKIGTRSVLEFPVGRPVLDNNEQLDWLRVSRDGTRVAAVFAQNPRWSLVVVDGRGEKKVLVSNWLGLSGVAWSPDGREVWFTGRRPELGRGTRALYAVDLEGHVRELLEEPGSVLTLHDVAPDGRVLLARDHEHFPMFGRRHGDTVDRELSWFDRSWPEDLSNSGELLLFNEWGASTRKTDAMAYVRGLDGSSAVKLLDTWAEALSADGKQALMFVSKVGEPEQLWIVPTGAGTERRLLPRGPIQTYGAGAFFPDGRRIAMLGITPGPRREPRVYVQDIEAGEPRAVTPPDTTFPLTANPVSTDGAWIFAADGKTATVRLYPVAGGEPRVLPGLKPRDTLMRWASDGRIFVLRVDGTDTSVVALDTTTGGAERVATIAPADRAGVSNIETATITADGKSYVYSYTQRLSRLYIVEGLR